jgi:hypothetical protein
MLTPSSDSSSSSQPARREAREALEDKHIGRTTLVTPVDRASRPVQQVARALEQVAHHQPVEAVDWVVLQVEGLQKQAVLGSRIRLQVHLFLMAVLGAAAVGIPLVVQVERAAALLAERMQEWVAVEPQTPVVAVVVAAVVAVHTVAKVEVDVSSCALQIHQPLLLNPQRPARLAANHTHSV